MKIGDLVRVKDNLQVGFYYGGVVFDRNKEEYKGEIGVIIGYNCDGYIIIDGFSDYFGAQLAKKKKELHIECRLNTMKRLLKLMIKQ